MAARALSSEETQKILSEIAVEIAGKYGMAGHLSGPINAMKFKLVLGEIASGLSKRSLHIVEVKK